MYFEEFLKKENPVTKGYIVLYRNMSLGSRA